MPSKQDIKAPLNVLAARISKDTKDKDKQSVKSAQKPAQASNYSNNDENNDER